MNRLASQKYCQELSYAQKNAEAASAKNLPARASKRAKWTSEALNLSSQKALNWTNAINIGETIKRRREIN